MSNFNNRINRIEKTMNEIPRERCPVCQSGWRHRVVVGKIESAPSEDWCDANGKCVRCGEAISVIQIVSPGGFDSVTQYTR